MELVTQHRIFYSNKELVPLGEIAESLVALERIIKHTPKILENIFPGTKVLSVNVFIQELKSGSIYEDIVVKFIFGSQERLDEFIDSTRKMVGMEYLSKNPKLFSAIVLAAILSGGIYTLKKNAFPNSNDLKKLELHNEITISYGATLAQMPPEELKFQIENSIKDKEKITKNSIKLLYPARKDPEAIISFDDTPDLTLPPAVIKAMPSFVKEEEPEETLEDYKDVEIIIRATDLDSQKRGWAAVVPTVSNRRTKLQLDPMINPEELMAKPSIIGDITVVSTYDEKANKIPKIIYLRGLKQ